MHKHMKGSDGKYHINGQTFELLNGSRAQVHHGTAYKTDYGLKKKDILKNKHGRFVSKKKHDTAKKEKRLEKHGFFAMKGKFGMVKGQPKRSTKRSKSSKRSTRRKAHTV